MATHSSILAWRIPGTEEPGGLSSMGLHRVGHNWRDLAAAAYKFLCKHRFYFQVDLYLGMELIGFPRWLVIKNPLATAGDAGDQVRSLGQEDSPGAGDDNPLQYYCPENFMDRGTWRATVHGATKSQTQWVTVHHKCGIKKWLRMRYHLTLVIMAIIKKSANSNCWRGYG